MKMKIELETVVEQGKDYDVEEFIKSNNLNEIEGNIVRKLLPYYNDLNLGENPDPCKFKDIMELNYDTQYWDNELEDTVEGKIFEAMLERFGIR